MGGHGDVCGKKLGGRKRCTERVVRGVSRKKVGGEGRALEDWEKWKDI